VILRFCTLDSSITALPLVVDIPRLATYGDVGEKLSSSYTQEERDNKHAVFVKDFIKYITLFCFTAIRISQTLWTS